MGNADGIISEEDIDKTQEICYTYDKGIDGIGKRQGANGREKRGMWKKAMIICSVAAICLIPFFFWNQAIGKVLGGVGCALLILGQIFNWKLLIADGKKEGKENSEPDNSAADTLPPSQPEPPRTPYTLDDFKEDVAQTKAKMEELAAYLKTIDAAVKNRWNGGIWMVAQSSYKNTCSRKWRNYGNRRRREISRQNRRGISYFRPIL